MKISRLGPFAGMDNRRPDHQLVKIGQGGKVGDFLRNAVNVDITTTGTLQRRRGVRRVLGSIDAHSLWSDGGDAFYVDGQTLYRLFLSEGKIDRVPIAYGLTPGLRCSFVRVGNGHVYWSNGLVLQRVINGVSGVPGVPVPNPAPHVTAGVGGSLPAGLYQVAVTAHSDAGEESGSTWPVQVAVPDKGMISVSQLQAGSMSACIYMSPVNGDVLYRVATLAPGIDSVHISVLNSSGAVLRTPGLSMMPAGQIVRHFHGRLLVASGNVLYYSEPYAPAWHHPLRGFIPFPSRVTIVEPCAGGVWVVADQTYWLAGDDIDNAVLRAVLPYGGVEGSGARMQNSKAVWWFSERGMVVAGEEGDAQAIQDEHIAVERAVSGASLRLERDGMQQMLSSLFGVGPSQAAAQSFMDAEVIRKEGML